MLNRLRIHLLQISCLVFILLLTFIPDEQKASKGVDFGQVKLRVVSKNYSCGQVYSNENDSYVQVELEKLYRKHKDIMLTVAIFKYSDMAYYDNFYLPRDLRDMNFNDIKEFSKGLHGFDEHEIEVEKYDLMETIRYPNIVIDYLIKEDDKIKYKVDMSGIYCVYVVPSVPLIIDALVSVTYSNSYGYLRYEDYVQYRFLKFITIIGALSFAIMLYYYYQYVICESSSMFFTEIYKRLLFYCLGPLIVSSALGIIPYMVANNTLDNDTLKACDAMELHLRNIGLLRRFPVCRSALYFGDSRIKCYTSKHQSDRVVYILSIAMNYLLIIQILLFSIRVLQMLPILALPSKILPYFKQCHSLIFHPSVIYYMLVFVHSQRKIKDDPLAEELDIGRSIEWSFFLIYMFTLACLGDMFKKLTSLLTAILGNRKANSYRNQLTNILDGTRLSIIVQNLTREYYLFKPYFWPHTLEWYILVLVGFLLWFRTSKLISKKMALKEIKARDKY